MPTPSVLFTATASPAPQVASGFTSAAAGAAPCASVFTTGDSTGVTSKLDTNAARLDLASRFGGGGNLYAVADGLAITGTTNPVIGVGHALVEGLVEVNSPITVAAGLTVGAWNYLWLTQAGTIIVTHTTTAPTSAKSVFIGAFEPNFGNVDISGVLYVQGSMILRQTADATAPTDTPPAGVAFLTRTAGGLYLWDGWEYLQVGGGGSGGVVYFGALPHSSTDSTAHDSWTAAARTGVHITSADRSDIAANAAAAATAEATATAAQTTANNAQATANSAATAAAAAVQTTDSRLSDARNPLPHAGTHYSTGSDPIHILSGQVDDFATAVSVAVGTALLSLIAGQWASGTGYTQGQLVQRGAGLYVSVAPGTNTGNDPATDSGANWRLAYGIGTDSQ